MADALALNPPLDAPLRSKSRDLAEVFIALGLVMMVIWTPRETQRLLWWVAAAGVATILWFSFEGWAAMGIRLRTFWRGFWIVIAALGLSAVAIAIAARLGTLRLPRTVIAFFGTYIAYAIWSGVQQFLLQGFFLARIRRLVPGASWAALATAALFSIAHLPSAFLAPITLLWGFIACMLFLRYSNLYPLALAHAILGITIALTVPGPVDHNMRVGLGYLHYDPHHPHHPHLPVVEPSSKE